MANTLADRAKEALALFVAKHPPDTRKGPSSDGFNHMDRMLDAKSFTTKLVRGVTTKPDIETLVRFADVAGVRVEWLVAGRGPRDAAAYSADAPEGRFAAAADFARVAGYEEADVTIARERAFAGDVSAWTAEMFFIEIKSARAHRGRAEPGPAMKPSQQLAAGATPLIGPQVAAEIAAKQAAEVERLAAEAQAAEDAKKGDTKPPPKRAKRLPRA